MYVSACKEVMAAVAPAAGGAGGPAYNQASVNRYQNSSPINFRLVLANFLLIGGCSFVIFASLASYTISVKDLDRITKLSVHSGTPPCGMSVPSVFAVFTALREVSTGPFAEFKEDSIVERTRSSFCGAEAATDVLRAALQTNEIPSSCCETNPDTMPTVDISAKVREYLCACDFEGNSCNNGDGYGDMLRRIKHAYVLSAPAFAVYVDSVTATDSGTTTKCTGQKDPFGDTVCPLESARTAVTTQLANAADNAFKILSGDADELFPDDATMLYRLLALGVIEYYDRTLNDGACFKNTNKKTTALEFCQEKLEASVPPLGSRSVGTVLAGGCANASLQPYYSRISDSDSCLWTSATVLEDDDERSNRLADKTKMPATRLRMFSDAYSSNNPVYGVCESLHEFGLFDRKRLFGVVDPVGNFEFYGENHGASFTRWLAGLTYWSLYDGNLKKIVAATHTPYLDLKLYVAYRYAATTAWTMAAIVACGYLLAYALIPITKLLYIRLIRRNVTNSPTSPIILKPLGTAEYLALVVGVVVGLWILFVDPAAYTPYTMDVSCDDYDLFGGAFVSTERRPREGLTGVVLAALCVFLLAYLTLCRRTPKKNRVLPLNPFPLWPFISIILVALISVLILIFRVGNEWWDVEANKQSGSTEKTTDDFEEVIDAGLWGIFFLALLMGVLNQRHMAANAALEVPLGQPPIFAYLWAATGFGIAVISAVFTWPLFDCQLAFESNQFVCGEGTQVNLRWDYFWGAIAFGACIVAVIFVFWASYKVLFSVPRKRNQANATFIANRGQEVAKLRAAQSLAPTTRSTADRFKFDLGSVNVAASKPETTTMMNPSIASGSSVIAASFVASPNVLWDTKSVEGEPLIIKEAALSVYNPR